MVRSAAFGLLGVLAWFGLPASAPPQSASFACAKASHPLEKTICASANLARLDGEVAALYRAKLAQMFDKEDFRAQQRNWQQILRLRCAKTCDPATVERDYVQQRDALRAFGDETWEASYKTADVATLTIRHLDARQFGFTFVRDRGDELLCKVPADDSANDPDVGGVATIVSPVSASWASGSCKLSFKLTRDKTGHVTRIDTAATQSCRRYCTGGYELNDVFLPANNWVAGNQ
ncbi:lysozyme inhibitor LprI family protein [Sphingomonas sp. MMS12-HWE2-04]|uniref:lysozyme inhibitor LprI family protein n=1 Tax=Sphingomonas sp. MMS12-HWE2-04 TaxID=3234199 RepID=UPI00384C3065